MTAGLPTGVRVVEASADDVDDIAALDALSPASRRLLGHDLGAADRCCLVARAGALDEVVGYAAAIAMVDEAHVMDVAVDVAWRRRGVATGLLVELSRRLAARCLPALTLEVRADNAGARALYRRLGFVVEGRRRGYYPDGEDALVLWRREATSLTTEGG